MLMGERFVSNCLENKKDVPLAIKTAASKTLALKGFIRTVYSKKGFLKTEYGKALLHSYPDSADKLFAIAPNSIETVADKIGEPSAELEKVEICGNAAFWSFDRKLYAKANWWKKTATPGIGEMVTIRTANTLRKIAEM